MKPKTKHRVVLADDHPFMLEAIADCIGHRFRDRLEVVAKATDGLMAVEEVKKHKPDLILMDLGMPRLDGVGAIRQIKQIQKDIVVLVLSMYDDQAHIVQAIQAGADDYLFKKEVGVSDIVGHVLTALEKDLAHQDKLHKTV